MTDEHATFLKAIIARPDLDLPRLVYADWLEGTAGQKPCPACPELGYGNEPEWTTEIPLYWCGQCDQATRSVPNGHAERAEFIRVQCELARMPEYMAHLGGFEPHDALRRREREILFDHGFKWGKEAVPVPAGYKHTLRNDNDFHVWSNENVDGMRYSFRRGFVESIACRWSDFRAHAAAIMAATPLRRVRLTTWPAGAEGYDAQRVKLYCERAYRGIEFELPQLVDGVPV
jgi:uncharacterized protein (TIGR02996 family)